MEENDIIYLKDLHQNNEFDTTASKTSVPATVERIHTTAVRRGNFPISNLEKPQTPNDSPDSLRPSVSTSSIMIALPLADSTTAIDRPPNVVQNFLLEQDLKQAGSSISRQSILQNLLYIVLWYFFSTALSFYNKYLMGKHGFNLNLPILVSAIHAGMHFSLTAILMNGYCWFYPIHEEKSIPTQTYLARVVPTAIAAALEISLANSSYVSITLTFYTMVKSSTPVWVLMFAFIFGLEQPRLVLAAIILVISIGIGLTVAGETAFDLMGFSLVLGAAIISGLRWSLTQMLLQKEEAMYNPIAALYYLTPIMFGFMSIFSLVFENPLGQFASSEHFRDFYTAAQTFLLMIAGGLLAFAMNLAEFALIKNTSTVTLSVAGISKEVLVIALSVIFYHDKLTYVNILGLVISLIGIASYNYYKIRKSNYDRKGKYRQLPTHKNPEK